MFALGVLNCMHTAGLVKQAASNYSAIPKPRTTVLPSSKAGKRYLMKGYRFVMSDVFFLTGFHETGLFYRFDLNLLYA